MTEDRKNLLARRKIVGAVVLAVENVDKLLEVCRSVQGDMTATRDAVAEAFGVGAVEADAILATQVRRFTPHSMAQIRDELADLDRRLSDESDA